MTYCKLCDNDPEDEINDSPYEPMNNTCQYYQPADVTNVLAKDSNSLSVFRLNCQGLKSHWDSFLYILQELSGGSSSFYIIWVTKLYSMSEGECGLNGYHPMEFQTRTNTTDSRGGVAMYIKETYKYKHRPDLSIFIPNIFEYIFIEIQSNNKNILTGTIYRPNTPPKADIDIFMHNIRQLQTTLSDENENVIMMGDINIDLLKFSTHNKTNEFMDNTFAQGYIPIITKQTRVTY